MTDGPSLAVVCPVYNEGPFLVESMMGLAANLERVVGVGNWRFVFVDNGSADDTAVCIEKLKATFPLTEYIHLPSPNFGRALRVGLVSAAGTHALVVNSDHWDPIFIEWSWRVREDYDLLIGSKRADPYLNHQPPFRRFLSWGLNSILQLLFQSVVSDTHGIKLLDLETMSKVIEQCKMERGQFDTEFTLRALMKGMRIAEAPVVHIEERPPRNFMTVKILRNLKDLWKLWRLMRDQKFEGELRYRRWSREDIAAE